MKRVLLILSAWCCLISAAASLHTYVESSVLAEGNFVKIRVAQTGLCRITYEQLREMGLQPERVAVLGYGGVMLEQDFMQSKIDDLPVVPLYMDKGSDGVFGKGDFILFYARGPVGWTYTGARFRHSKNVYSDYGYYFLTDRPGLQQLLQPLRGEVKAANAFLPETFQDYRLHELDSVNLVDTEGKEGAGREFYGDRIYNGHTARYSFDFPNIDTTSPVYTYIDVAAVAEKGVPTTMHMRLGGSEIDLLIPARSTSDNFQTAAVKSGSGSFMPAQGDRQTLELQYESPSAGALVYLNYFELTAWRRLRMAGNLLFVRNAENYASSRPSLFRIAGCSDATQVWNVTRPDSIYAVPALLTGDTLSFLAVNMPVQEFVVLNPSAAPYIEPVAFWEDGKSALWQTVPNQNLHRLRDVDMLILTNRKFLTAARRLAEAHMQHDGMTVEVVTDEEVYNEFSSGTPDATAYRWVMKMLRDRALEAADGTHAPSYLLLVGDGSFDNRKIFAVSAPNTLLTYQARNSVSEVEAYATDDYFGYLEDKDGLSDITNTMDIAVGRLPVNTAEEAQSLVDKLIRYMQNNKRGRWKHQLCFVADDGDGTLHTKAADNAAEAVRAFTGDYIINKIYLDSYQQETDASGERYPLAKSKFDNLMHKGILFFDYCGHASFNNITSEMLLTAAEARSMTNENQGFWMLATCNFAQFDATFATQTNSAAEGALLNPNGGAVSLLASCRTVYASQNEVLNTYVSEELFRRDSTGTYPTIGQAVQRGKNRYAANLQYRDKNRLPYILLGDPALRLLYPEDYNVQTTSRLDTLRALSTATLSGYIAGADGDTVTSFNGRVEVTVFDKQQTVRTLDNDGGGKNTTTFTDYPNMLFNGSAEVAGGKFTVAFMVPKDIRYNFGQGRVVYYAYDTISNEEAVGHYDDFIIGGSSVVEITDTIGPDVRLYLNNSLFVDGGKTHDSPHVYADLFDENGINTIGNGIGHDMLLVVDNDMRQTYILNDYFTALPGSYQAGNVSYRLNNLAEGRHTMLFRVWDLVNNSTTRELNFEVVKGLPTTVYSVLTVPNPVAMGMPVRLIVQHDRPDAVLQTELSVYNTNGFLVWRHTQNGAGDLQFTPSALGMGPGIYFYRVRLRTEDTEYTSASGKLIIY